MAVVLALGLRNHDRKKNVCEQELWTLLFDTLPTWAATLAAGAAAWAAISSNKLSKMSAKANLVRDISNVDNQTLLLIYGLLDEISSKRSRLRDRMIAAGYDSRDIEDTIGDAIGSDNEQSLVELTEEIEKSLSTSDRNAKFDDLMKDWHEAIALRAQYTRIRVIMLNRLNQLEMVMLGTESAHPSQ